MNEANSQPMMSGTGYLIVRVSTALGAIPVEGATVVIRSHEAQSDERGGTIAVLNSQSDGNTPKIELAAPPKNTSTSPGNSFPYATYNIDVFAEGYYRQYFNNVPVYDGVTSIQPATLVPISQTPNPDRIDDGGQFFEENVNPSLRTNPEN